MSYETELVQRMVQAIYDAIPWDGAEPIPLDEMAAKDWMERDAAAVLPIIEREVQAAKAEALREAAGKLMEGTWPDGFFSGIAGAARELTARATEYETGAEHDD